MVAMRGMGALCFTRLLMHLMPLEGRICITGGHEKVVRERRKLAPCHEGKQQQGCNMFSPQAHAIKLFIPVYEYTSALRLFQSSLMKSPGKRSPGHDALGDPAGLF